MARRVKAIRRTLYLAAFLFAIHHPVMPPPYCASSTVVVEASALNVEPDVQRLEAVPDLRSLVVGKRVGVLVHELSATGAPRVSSELARILTEEGARVEVLFVPPSVESRAGLRALVEMEHRKGNVSLAIARTRGLNPHDFDASYVSRLAQQLYPELGNVHIATFSRAAAFDLIVASTAAPHMTKWIIAFRRRYPLHRGLAWYIHEGRSVMNQFHRSETPRALAAMRLVDSLLVVSQSALGFWEGAGLRQSLQWGGRGGTPVTVVPWGIPQWRAERLTSPAVISQSRSSVRAGLGLFDNATLMLSLGYFSPIKGQCGIVKAFLQTRRDCPGHARGAHLVLAGGGGMHVRKWLQDSADVLVVTAPGSHVHIFSRIDAEAFVLASDVFVSNTQFGGESWGLSTLEASAAGKPVLATASGGTVQQQAHNVTALLHSTHPPTGVRQLSAHMCRLMRDRGLAARLGAAGQARAGLLSAGTPRKLAEAFAPILAPLASLQINASSAATRPLTADLPREPFAAVPFPAVGLGAALFVPFR